MGKNKTHTPPKKREKNYEIEREKAMETKKSSKDTGEDETMITEIK